MNRDTPGLSNRTRGAFVGAVLVPITDIQPGTVGSYIDQLNTSLPTKKLQLSALRAFLNVCVSRQVLILNPATTVRCDRYQVVEGKTSEISG